jgi:hypothetical protein
LAQIDRRRGEPSDSLDSTTGIQAQWESTAKALDWLEAAWRRRDLSLLLLKTDLLLDPLRKEPRFQAIERELKFPS